MKYSISIVALLNYKHAGVFNEIINLIYFSFKNLGLDIILSKKIEKDRRNIIVGVNLLRYKKNINIADVRDFFPKDTILYNAESAEQSEHFDTITQAFLREYEVWDFNDYNAKLLNDRYGTKIKKSFLMGYIKQLDVINHDRTKDIDILFMGAINNRRKKILDDMKNIGLNVVHLFGVYGKEKDLIIERSKLHINIHSQGPRVLEPFRINYYLINGCPILSEMTNDLVEFKTLKDIICFRDYSELAITALRLVNDEKLLNDLKKKSYNFIKSRPLENQVKKLLL